MSSQSVAYALGGTLTEPSVPFMATYTIKVRSLSAIKTILAGAAIATSPLGADILARFPKELGQGAWIFTERGSVG